MQVFENSQKNWILQTWPTSQREYKKEPYVNFLVSEDTIVNIGDKIKSYEQKTNESEKTIFFEIKEIVSEMKSAFRGKKVVRAKFERQLNIIQLKKKEVTA